MKNVSSEKKCILITGASGGMGLSATRFFRDRGFTVFALDCKELPSEDGIIPILADITDEKSVAEASETVSRATSSLFSVLHFAGVYMLHSLVEMPTDEFRRIVDVNLTGSYLVNKAFRPLLQKGSRILIVTSELACLDPLPFTGIYAVTKGALDRYAYSLAMELQLSDISVSVLRAGAVNTGMLAASTNALGRFCNETKLYRFSSKRFQDIVNRVEARHVLPDKIAEKAFSVLKKKRPRFSYSINRNPWLLLLNALPKKVQLFIIKMILS